MGLKIEDHSGHNWDQDVLECLRQRTSSLTTMRTEPTESLQPLHLSHTSWQDADLQGADFSYSDLRNIDARYADLRGAKLEWADLGQSDLRCADLRGVKMKTARLTQAKLNGAVFDEYSQLPFTHREALAHGMVFARSQGES